MSTRLTIRPATRADVPQILTFIRELARYERLEHEVVATAEQLTATLFGPTAYAEVVIAWLDDTPVGFALFFHSYSTFLARPGIYLEDLFVRDSARGQGVGAQLLAWLARTALQRGCGRLEWSVLDWNADAIGFYRNLGAVAQDEWTRWRVTGAALEKLARAQR